MKKYALVTDEGTAISESCICEKHDNITNRNYINYVIAPSDAITTLFFDVSNNDACECIFCGGQNHD